MEAAPDSSNGPLSVTVCQMRRERTELLIFRNCDQAETPGLRFSVCRKNCHSSIAAMTARKKSMTVLKPQWTLARHDTLSPGQCSHTSLNESDNRLDRWILTGDRPVRGEWIPHVVEVFQPV